MQQSNTFPVMNELENAIKNNGQENTTQTSTSPWGCAPPSNTPTPGTTPITAPNHSPIGSCTFAQLCHKVPIGNNGMPHIHPQNCSFPSASSIPSNTPIPRLIPLTTLNSIQIQSAIFPQFIHRTDRLTDGLGDKPIEYPLTIYCINSE